MRAAFVAIAAGLVGHAARLMLEKEYPSWAPVLASLLVRVAGWICPVRRREWWADVQAVQDEGATGLWEATQYLMGAPWLSLRWIALGLVADSPASRTPPSAWKMQHYRHDS
jgi:hypothetical protein